VQVRFWGTRGSVAAPGASTIRYGGNTACVELRSDSGSHLVLDCGTGARLLGKQLVAQGRRDGVPASGVLLIGHTHWDHIQGLPFFAPLFQDDSVWHVYGPRGLNESLAKTLAGQMQYQYFPVTLEQLAAHVSFHDLVEGSFEIGDLRVSAQYLNHPALTLGYRIEGDGVSVVYACDHEPFDPELAYGGEVPADGADGRHAQFLADADLLIHDAQYRPEEYPDRRGWGHSTVDYAVSVASAARVKTLALFHHDPDHDDETVDAMLATAREQAAGIGFTGTIIAAAEGATVQVRPHAHHSSNGHRNGASAIYDASAGRLSARIVLAVSDPALRQAVCDAAAQEHLPVVDASDADHTHNTVVVFDHDDAQDSSQARGERRGACMVLALTRGRPGADGDACVSDWLVWPSSIGHIRTKLRAAVLRRACRWQNAPLPANEPARLAALRGLNVLDTPAEERFDRITADACREFDVPYAVVSLVDQTRQWFKSHHGIEIAETPRDQSVCTHAILADSVLQVPDLSTDDRFADSPMVAGPLDLRFYAGAPLVLSDGSRVGTLCIGDRRPRVLSEAQLEQLQQLAHAVRDELESSVAATT
jgi:phosphoribosyl 1,2-cyclic phosphodiesterase